MEQRKLIQHGLSSLTVALPIKWVKEHNLKKGENVFIDIDGNKIILSTKEQIKNEKISINVTNLDRTSILIYIQSLYRYGYNEIEVNFKKQKTKHFRTSKEVSISSIIYQIVNRCIGTEIIEQTSEKILIKAISKETDEDFKIILRRAFLLLIEASVNLLDGIKNNDFEIIDAIENMHDNINKFVNYCLRLLNKYGHEDTKKTCFYYHIIASLDKIMDIIKYNAREILDTKQKISNDAIIIWGEINRSIRGYYELFYNFDLDKVRALSENRNKIKLSIMGKSKLSNKELMLLNNMKQILEIILDLTEFRIGLEH